MGKLIVLMVTAFVDMVGLLMVLPLLPFYAVRLRSDGVLISVLDWMGMSGDGFVVAVLIASFSVAQLVSAPVWGRVSDRYGRRPALLIGLAASTLAYIVFAFAGSVDMLFLSRIVQGAGGGTVGVIQAYVADATDPENRARSLGWLSAATSVGVALGPALGSLSRTFGDEAPGLIAAMLCVLNIIFAWFFLRESHTERSPVHGSAPVRRSREAVWHVIAHPNEPSSRLIWIYAIVFLAFSGMTAVLALFLAARFGVDESTIGFFFVYIGVISVITRAGILGWAVDRFGEARLSRLGVLLLAAGLAGLPFARGYVSLAIAVALVPLGTAFTFPCVTSLLSRVIGAHERGLYMGVQQSFGGIARVLGPLWAGIAYDRLGIGVPFWTGAALVVTTIFLGLDMEDYTRESSGVTAASG